MSANRQTDGSMSGKPSVSDTISYTTRPTPIGTMYMAATDRGICRITYDATDEEFIEDLTVRYRREVVYSPEHPQLQDVETQIDRYFLGELQTFATALDFLEGTPFHQQVWRTLTTIPYGQVRSYKWVAEQIGKPLAARAVGQANSRNRISILIPCHRVINHDGGIGGFGDRIDIKAYLLRLEGAVWGRGRRD